MDVLSRLQSHPLFETFDPAALAEAVRAGTPVTYETGDVCIAGADAGEVFGVLISGRLEAVGSGPGHARGRLGFIEAGECFGEMSLLTGEQTHAEVVAAENSDAVIFCQEAISPLIAENPHAVRFLTRLIKRRLAAPAAAEAPRAATPTPRFTLGASQPMRILSMSCRQSDVRYCLFDTTCERAVAWGKVIDLGSAEARHLYEGPQAPREQAITPAAHPAAIEAVFTSLTDPDHGVLGSIEELSGVGHRVCHGGAEYGRPVVVDDSVKAEIARLTELAPQDNSFNLMGIEICQRLAPTVAQVAVFDTAFHLKMPPAAHRYALPKDLTDELGIRRFGFHGISHEGAARAVAEQMHVGPDSLRVVTVHLGAGASITAIDHGRSIGNTMGMTPLEGLVMATRPGDLDAGVLLHLLRRGKTTVDELSERLYADSGLLGLSGISADARDVLKAANDGNTDALIAVQVYCRRARQYLSAYVGVLGGVDAIAFTGAIGRYCAGVRARTCQGLDWMGIRIDEARNREVHPVPGEVIEISPPQSRARIFIAGSHEQKTIACKSVQAIGRRRVTNVMRRKKRAIPVGISAHHVHLTQEHVEALFGPGHTLTPHADLTQPGQFACQEKVAIIGPRNRIENVRVLGPVRPQTQVEISRTEEFKLGIDAPVRLSGDLDGTPGITLEGPAGQVTIDHGVICAMRHIHMSPEDAMALALRDHDRVRIRVDGERSLIFGDVVVRVHPDFRLDMHIDTDEANAAELTTGVAGFFDAIERRAAG